MMGIHFASYDRIIFLPIFLAVAILFIRNHLRLKRLNESLVTIKYKKIVFPHFSLFKSRVKVVCMLLALASLFIAMLRPQWGESDQKVIQEGRDLLIVLDVSRSMLAEDLKPSRLEFAKLKVRKLLEKLTFERVGLVLFSGSSFTLCPLTPDYSAFLMFLKQVDVEAISTGTTALDNALMRSVDTYEGSNRKSKLVLLLTDGEDFSQNLKRTRARLESANVKVFALGIGSDAGAPIPILDRAGNQIGHEMDGDNVAMSKLNEPLLKDITSSLGGEYFRSGYDDTDISKLVESIKKFEKEKFEEKKVSNFKDHYPWFLLITFVLLLFEWLL